jgi:hypothetical protein
MTGIDDGIVESIDGAATVLLVAPSHMDSESCTDLLTRQTPARANVLCATLNAGPDDRLEVWQRYVGEELPRRTTILDGRGGDGGGDASAVSNVPSIKLEALAPDADLLDLAITVAAQIGAWTDSGSTSHLCFDSLSTLLDRYEAQEVVDLVRGLNTLCDDLGVFAHYHLDPKGCPESTVAMLRPLYDAVVEHDGGGWIVSEADDGEARPSFRGTVASTDESPPPDADRSEPVPLPYSFDTVLELVGDPIRRSLLYSLRDWSAGEIPLEELLEDVHARVEAEVARDPDTRERTELQLVHTHLPKLQAEGVIDFDPGTGTITYRSNRGLESHLDYLEPLERG